jgi:probable rRNA maturation factor
MIRHQVHVSDAIDHIEIPGIKKFLTLVAQDFHAKGQLSIAVLSDAEIRELNKRYLNHDYETDCISFNLADDEEEDEESRVFDGEVLISWETACRSAKEVGWAPEVEALLYIIHGVLHILGCDDQTPESKQEMRDLEQNYLCRLKVDGWEKHR